MKNLLNVSLATILIALITGCASLTHQTTPLYQNEAYYNYLQDSFEDYVSVSREWLKHNRNFISDQKEKELMMNAPFMLKSETPSNKAALLVHGLGDSPYYFRDIAMSLQAQGFDVQVLLLPGHGSKPADLILPRYEDWQVIVDHYTQLLTEEYDEVWLGGFSTGGNLVTINAIEQGEVDGLLLFSPGFETHSPFIEKLAPLVASFTDWGWTAEEDNLARYRSSPVNASIAYTDSALKVRALFKEHSVTIPTFIVMTEADSVINPYAIKGYFENNFSHADSKMLWYGESIEENEQLIVKTMKLPEEQISTGSHMSPLFSPENMYYGKQGEKRLCGNSFSSSKTKRCEQGDDVWFSAWGYGESDKLFARLSWNPYFKEMEQQIGRFLRLN